MIFSSNPLYNALKVYIIIIILLIIFKPSFIYDRKLKKFRQFGTSKGNTIFTLPVLSILLAVLLYLMFLSINKMTNTTTKKEDNNNIFNNQLFNQQLFNQQLSQQLLNHHLLQQLNKQMTIAN